MLINGEEVTLTEEDKALMQKFIAENIVFLVEQDFSQYESIEKLSKVLETFIIKNNLKNNNAIMLFLLELKRDELIYKKKNIKREKVDFLDYSTFYKWFSECTEIEENNLTK